MTTKDLAFLACRLFALYLLAQAVVWLVYIYGGSRLSPVLTAGQYSLYAAVPGVSLIGAGVFWKWADWLAQKIAGGNSGRQTISSESFQTAGFTVIGMYLLAEAIPGIVFNLALIASRPEQHWERSFNCIRLAAMLMLGFALLLGAGRITRLLEKTHKRLN